jgi:hypothetical protein
MIGFIDAFFYNHSWVQSITTAHNQSIAEDSLRSPTPVSILLQHLNWLSVLTCPPFYNFGTDRIENTTSNSSSIIMCLFVAAEMCLATRYPATDVLVHIVESVTLGMCLRSRCLAMVKCFVVFISKEAWFSLWNFEIRLRIWNCYYGLWNCSEAVNTLLSDKIRINYSESFISTWKLLCAELL